MTTTISPIIGRKYLLLSLVDLWIPLDTHRKESDFLNNFQNLW